MKRLTVFAVALIVISTIMPICHGQKMIISIGQFKNKTKAPDQVLNTLIDRITNSIVNTRKFKVVDNARLKEAMSEHQKVDMGMSDAKNAPEKGKIKSAGYIIYGTVLALGANADGVMLNGVKGIKFNALVELNIRFMDVQTGELVASKTVKAEQSFSQLTSGAQVTSGNKSQIVLQDTIQEAADKVVSKLVELAYPTVILKVSASRIYVNLPEERANMGDVLNVFSAGEELTDPDTGESLGSSEEKVGELRIIRTSPKFSIAVPIAPLTNASLQKGMIIRPVSKQELDARQAQVKTKTVKRFRKRF
jgi:curli biogenesis system outer membrane secretion channel CsgG